MKNDYSKTLLLVFFALAMSQFALAQQPTIRFAEEASVVSENSGSAFIQIDIENAGGAAVTVNLKVAEASTAVEEVDYEIPTTISIPANNTTPIRVEVDILDNTLQGDSKYLIIEFVENQNIIIGEPAQHIVLIQDNDAVAPQPQPQHPIQLEQLDSYKLPNNAIAKVVAHDELSQLLFVVGDDDKLYVLTIEDPSNIRLQEIIDLSSYGGVATSVDVKNGIVAVAIQAEEIGENGTVLFYDVLGELQSSVKVGAGPTMLTFTPDGTKVVVANEGEPNDDYSIDPEGSISLIDITNGVSSLSDANVLHLNFQAFNSQRAALARAGVRFFGPNASVAQDLEPEFITVLENSSIAIVTLQENNAAALVTLGFPFPAIVGVAPLGFKDFSLPENSFDASDTSPGIFFNNWPVLGMFQPKAIANFTIGTEIYAITVNEGEARTYSGFNEEVRLGDESYVLDPQAFPNAAYLKNDNLLGRLKVSNALGDTNGDGDFDQIYTFGGRSFSIFTANIITQTASMLYDSGNDLEQITASSAYGELFNSPNNENIFKGRSDDKGPEPTGVVVGKIAGKPYAFIGLNQTGGILLYDVSDPTAPQFIQYTNPRTTDNLGGDLGPQGLEFIPLEESPTNANLLVVAHEVSGTVTVYQVGQSCPPVVLVDTLSACVGEEVTLLAPTGYDSYVWRNNLGVFSTEDSATTTVPGSYILEATVSSIGCTVRDTVEVVLSPLPEVGIDIDTTTCVNGTLTLAAIAGAEGYTFLWSDGSTNDTLTITADGVYSVTVTSPEGCVTSVMETIDAFTTGLCTHVNDILAKGELLLSPNPANDWVQVEATNLPKGDYTLRLLNTTGQLVVEKTVQTIGGSFLERLDLAGLPKSIYLVRLQSEHGFLTKRIVLQ